MAEYSDSTKALFARSNNTELRDRGYKEESKTPEYIEDSSEPVPVAKYRDRPGFLKIPVHSTSVFGVFGGSGAGKTTADMSIATRCFNRGRIPANFADTDLHTTNLDNHGGVSKKLIEAMRLYKGEEPTEIAQKTVLPKYLWNKLSKERRPSNVDKFSLGFQDINDSELKFLLGQGLDSNQKQAMQNVLDKVSVDENLDFDDLRNAVDGNDDLHHTTGNKLKRNINNLENSEVISNRYRKDIVNIVNQGNSLGVGMRGFNGLSPSDYYLMEFLAKKCFEKIIDARKSGELDQSIFSIFPEAHHLMPRGEDSLLANYVKRVATYHQRRTDTPIILDSQNPSQIPENILEEVNSVFIGCDESGKSLAKSEWSDVLKKMNVVANPQRDNRRWMKKIQKLNHRDFLYISADMTDPDDAPIVRFLAPLTSNP
jgi:hypothetical protein